MGVRGRDEAGLVGPLATSDVQTDAIAPAPVELQAVTNDGGSLRLEFTASGDDALTDEAHEYVVTFGDSVLDLVTNTVPAWEFVLESSQLESNILTAEFDGNAMPDGRYAIQVIAVDESGNRSFPSNAVSYTHLTLPTICSV